MKTVISLSKNVKVNLLSSWKSSMDQNDRENLEKILFVLNQTKDAIAFGIPQNVANRNLKSVLNRYWEKPMLGFSALGGKMKLPRSKAALKIRKKENLISEHPVPKQVIVNMLLSIENPTRTKIKNLLKRYWRIILITKEEDRRLNAKGLGLVSSMPENWDKKDVWARYKVVNIELSKEAINYHIK